MHWSTHNRSFRSNAQSYSEPGCRPCLKRSQPLLPNTGTARRGSWGRVRRERSVPPSSSREILHVRTPAQPSRRLGRQPSSILRNVLFFLSSFRRRFRRGCCRLHLAPRKMPGHRGGKKGAYIWKDGAAPKTDRDRLRLFSCHFREGLRNDKLCRYVVARFERQRRESSRVRIRCRESRHERLNLIREVTNQTQMRRLSRTTVL